MKMNTQRINTDIHIEDDSIYEGDINITGNLSTGNNIIIKGNVYAGNIYFGNNVVASNVFAVDMMSCGEDCSFYKVKSGGKLVLGDYTYATEVEASTVKVGNNASIYSIWSASRMTIGENTKINRLYANSKVTLGKNVKVEHLRAMDEVIRK